MILRRHVEVSYKKPTLLKLLLELDSVGTIEEFDEFVGRIQYDRNNNTDPPSKVDVLVHLLDNHLVFDTSECKELKNDTDHIRLIKTNICQGFFAGNIFDAMTSEVKQIISKIYKIVAYPHINKNRKNLFLRHILLLLLLVVNFIYYLLSYFDYIENDLIIYIINFISGIVGIYISYKSSKYELTGETENNIFQRMLCIPNTHDNPHENRWVSFKQYVRKITKDSNMRPYLLEYRLL